MQHVMRRYMAKSGDFRVVVVDATQVGRDLFSRMLPSPVALQLMTQAMTATYMLSLTLKVEGAILMKIQGDGPMGHLVAEAKTNGDVRAYVGDPSIQLQKKSRDSLFASAFGDGAQMTITQRHGDREFSGIVETVPGEMALNVANYLLQSEQIPSAITLGAKLDPQHGIAGAGGVLLQALPEADQNLMVIMEDRIAHLPQMGDIFSGADGHERLNKILFEGVALDLLEERSVRYHCPCSKERVLGMLASLSAEDRASLPDPETGKFSIACTFCGRVYECDQSDLDE